jgi:hypothetical protein
VNAFLNDDLLAAADPSRTPDPDIKMRTVLETAAKKIDKGFAGEPVVAASVRRTLGRTFGAIGVMDEAEKQLRAAMALYRSTDGADSVEAFKAESDLGGHLYNAGQPAQAETAITSAYEGLRRTLGESAPRPWSRSDSSRRPSTTRETSTRPRRSAAARWRRA